MSSWLILLNKVFSRHQLLLLGLICSIKTCSLVIAVPLSRPSRQPSSSRSAMTCCGATAHTPLPSPRVGAVTQPACGPPPLRLASWHSFHPVGTAAVRICASPCPVQTAPRYTARCPLATSAPSNPPLC